MRGLLMTVGFPDLPLLSLVLVLTVIVLGAMMFGWIADLLLGDSAFGTALNTGILLAGAFCGAWLWHRYGARTPFDPDAVRTGAATGAGLVLLLALTAVKR